MCRRVNRQLTALPDQLVRALARGEGGDNPAAVNWAVAGGVDCGLFQIRCYGPPYDHGALGLAFSPYRAGLRAMGTILGRAATFADPHPQSPFTAIQLAVLAHNWPWAAGRYHRYGSLPNPDRPAPWVPASLPASARTYGGWAAHYVATMTGS